MNRHLRTPSFPRMERWLPAIVILGGLVLWEIGARSGWIARVFFPPPTIIVLTLVKMVRCQIDAQAISGYSSWATTQGLTDKALSPDQFWDPRFVVTAGETLNAQTPSKP